MTSRKSKTTGKNNHLTPKQQAIIGIIIGVIFLLLLLFLPALMDCPPSDFVVRAILAIGCAGISAIILGTIQGQFPNLAGGNITAGGSFVVLLIILALPVGSKNLFPVNSFPCSKVNASPTQITFQPIPIRHKPALTEGDTEFDQYDVYVHCLAEVRITPDGKQLLADVYMFAQEIGPKEGETRPANWQRSLAKSWLKNKVLHDCSKKKEKITRIINVDEYRDETREPNAKYNQVYKKPGENGIIKTFEFRASGTDEDIGGRTGAIFHFNELTIELAPES